MHLFHSSAISLAEGLGSCHGAPQLTSEMILGPQGPRAQQGDMSRKQIAAKARSSVRSSAQGDVSDAQRPMKSFQWRALTGKSSGSVLAASDFEGHKDASKSI
jgi:hypothetical protein